MIYSAFVTLEQVVTLYRWLQVWAPIELCIRLGFESIALTVLGGGIVEM